MIRAVLVASLLISIGQPARADHAAEAEARSLYEQALRHYDLAEFPVAIEKFKRAYLLSNRPELLFNLAQAWRASKDYAQAAHFYRTFLELRPSAANRAQVEAALAEVEALALAQTPSPAPVPVPVPVVVAPSPAPLPQPVVAPPERATPFVRTSRGIAVVALGTLGGALLIGSAASGGLAVSRRNDYDAGCRSACNDSVYDSGRRAAIATDVLIVVGAACVIGAVILTLTRPNAKARRSLAVRF